MADVTETEATPCDVWEALDEITAVLDAEFAQEAGEKAMRNYILVDGKPTPEPDLFAWGQWMETADRRVALTEVAPGVEVSTVFLGLDHQVRDGGPPLLYETMVRRDGQYGDCTRYTTRGQALAGHETVCAELRDSLMAEAR